MNEPRCTRCNAAGGNLRFHGRLTILQLSTLCILTALASSDGAAAGMAGRVPGQLLVKPRAGFGEAALQNLLAGQGAQQQGIIRQIDLRLLRVPEERLVVVLDALSHNPNIEFAEPNYVVEADTIPNDIYYSYQWHLPKIGAPTAWNSTTGSSNVIIAILDSGVDSSHPDLAGQLVAGWNFIDNNANTSDVDGHGTPVAGTTAALGNNGLGVASVAWGCKIMPIRISDTNGYGYASAMADGLVWAADRGARVANISFGNVCKMASVNTAAEYFRSRGGVVTISSGNEGFFDTTAENPSFIMVGATDNTDGLASWSNRGNNLDLVAPGVNVVTTGRGGTYGYASGTSFSAPVVAGVAALILSVNPSLTAAQLEDIIKSTADDLGLTGWDTSFGTGRVNAGRAVEAASAIGTSDITPPLVTITAPLSGSTVFGTVTVNVTASDDTGVTRLELYVDGVLFGSSAGAAFSMDTTTMANGSHNLQTRAYDGAGNVGVSDFVVVNVQNAAPDTTAPSVRITSPVNGSTVSRTVKVYVTASDDRGVTRTELHVDGRFYASSSSSSAVFNWNTRGFAKGQHTLQAFALDAAGNIGASAVCTVRK